MSASAPEARTDRDRVVTIAMNVSADGYVCGPDGKLDWVFQSMSPEMETEVVDYLRGVDTVLIGAGAYPGQAAQWPNMQGPMADLLNSHEKVVFATGLEELTWNSSRSARGSATEEVSALKQAPGKDIFVTGGATLAQSLARDGLVDEYRLFVHPTVLGAGKPLFPTGGPTTRLELTQVKEFPTGTVLMNYRVA